MSYCNNCGAYIPDGQTKCLACGLDETEQKKTDTSGSAAQSASNGSGRFDAEFLRQQLEEQRRRQRENSRKWAEAEHARRQRDRDRRPGGYAADAGAKSGAHSRQWDEGQSRYSASAPANKTMAALSYLGILCFLPYFLCRDDEFAAYHARQGLGLLLFGVGANLLSTIFGLNWLVSIFWVYMIYKGMTTAAAGKLQPLPYIGSLFLKK